MISLTGIGAYFSQSQLSSSKKKKKRDNSFSNQFDWNKSLLQPKKVFKFQKCKKRETILLGIDLTGIGAYISQNLTAILEH